MPASATAALATALPTPAAKVIRPSRGQARCEVLIYENTKLYVPTGTLELYKNADCWKKYITRRNLVRQEMCYNLKSSMH